MYQLLPQLTLVDLRHVGPMLNVECLEILPPVLVCLSLSVPLQIVDQNVLVVQNVRVN